MTDNGWSEWKNYVLGDLKRQGDELKSLNTTFTAHVATEAQWQREVSQQLSMLAEKFLQPRRAFTRSTDGPNCPKDESKTVDSFKINSIWGGLVFILGAVTVAILQYLLTKVLH